jgi:hypothetical protein
VPSPEAGVGLVCPVGELLSPSLALPGSAAGGFGADWGASAKGGTVALAAGSSEPELEQPLPTNGSNESNEAIEQKVRRMETIR